MAQKIYSETFITSKNPTEWSFTWIAFNNNPFPSSVFAPIRSSSSTFSRFLYQPTKYLFMVLDSILRSSENVCKWDWGSKHQQKLQFTTSMEEKSPNFLYSQLFTPLAELTIFRLLLLSCFSLSPLSAVVNFFTPHCHHFTTAALSQWIIYFDNINFYGHKLCLSAPLLGVFLTTLKKLFNF